VAEEIDMSRAIRFVPYLLACLLAQGLAWSASAVPLTYALTGVAFDDGGAATGTLTIASLGGITTVSDWSLSVSGGNTTNFPPLTYTPTNSQPSGIASPAGIDGVSFDLNVSLRQLRLTPVAILDGTSNSVLLDVVSDGGSGSVECFDCAPARLITAGSLTLVPEPASGGLLLTAFATLASLAVLRGRET